MGKNKPDLLYILEKVRSRTEFQVSIHLVIENSISDRVYLSDFKLVHSFRRFTGNPEGITPANSSHLEYE